VELREYVEVLRRRSRVIIVPVVLAAAVSAGITLSGPTNYQSATTLFYTPADASSNGPVSQRLQAYATLASSPRVADAVSGRLDRALSDKQVQDSLSATASSDTLLLTVTATSTSPQQAEQISEAAATELISLAGALEPSPSQNGATNSTRPVMAIAQSATAAVSMRPATVLRTIPLAIALGLLLGVIIALLVDSMDDRILRGRQLQDDDHLPTLASIVRDPSGGRVGVLMLDPTGPWAEAFRRLRTRLYPVGGADPRRIVVAGCLPGSGATTVACGLGLTLARAGIRVVLVGADLRNPDLADQLWIENGMGLSEVLDGTAALEDVLQPRSDGMLTVLPAGSPPPNPGELLGSSAMTNLLAKLEESFDLVVLEAPPVLQFADTVILSGLAGCKVLLVVRYGRTRRAEVRAAVQMLEETAVGLHGAVITMVPGRGDERVPRRRQRWWSPSHLIAHADGPGRVPSDAQAPPAGQNSWLGRRDPLPRKGGERAQGTSRAERGPSPGAVDSTRSGSAQADAEATTEGKTAVPVDDR
jgi:capsular exopolysaccharide synthesis family protein